MPSGLPSRPGRRPRVAVVGPTHPYKGGVAAHTTETAHRLARRALFGFIVTFVLARVFVFLIMAGEMPNLYFFMHGTHVHHLNYGIFLLAAVCGYSVFRRPIGRAAEITARFSEWATALSPLSLALQEIHVSPRGGWRLRAIGPSGPLDLELGRDEPGERLARFAAVYGRTIQALARAGTRVDRVDLRYRNGFAARVPGFHERPAKKAGAA